MRPSERSACVRACLKTRSVRSPSPPKTFLLLLPPCDADTLALSASASAQAPSTDTGGTGSAACPLAQRVPVLRPRPFTRWLIPASGTALGLGLGLGLDQGLRLRLCAAACCAQSASRVCARLAATPGLRQRSVRSSCPTLAARQAQCASRSRLAAARATCPVIDTVCYSSAHRCILPKPYSYHRTCLLTLPHHSPAATMTRPL